ncbi:MAG TPA: GNAT family N-acetyltransferase [Burkholderiaceae bacterium]
MQPLPHTSPMFTISRAALEDAPTILAMQRRAFAEEGRLCGSMDILPLAEPLAAIAEHIAHHTAFVARIGQDIVGAIRGVAADGVCTIRGLCIEPAHHGCGMGSALLAALEAAHPEVARFALTTNTVMPLNVRFYERHGYHVRELTRVPVNIVLAQMEKVARTNSGN